MKRDDDYDIPEDDMRRLRDAAKRNAEAITGSEVFVCMFNKKMMEDPIPLMQMGMAVYLDKPIYILVDEGRVLDIPENLRRMSRGLRMYKHGDTESLHKATKELLADADIHLEEGQ